MRRRRTRSFDLVQAVEGYTAPCDISYVHFCHRRYLRGAAEPQPQEPQPRGPREIVRRLDHRLRALDEARALGRARLLVVPSPGLARDLDAEFGFGPERVREVPNPVDLARFAPSAEATAQARDKFRRELGCGQQDLLVAFVALGHFERKGLPQLIDGLAAADDPSIHLVVVGGQEDLLERYRGRAAERGVSSSVHFVGMQPDVRPYLWAADAFAFPSSYEVFALAPLQAAASGLPLLVTTVAGVAPFFRDGAHGIAVRRDAADIGTALLQMAHAGPAARRAMGQRAREAVRPYGVEPFVERWREIYREALDAG